MTTRAGTLAPDYAIAWDMEYRPFGPLEGFTFANGLDVGKGDASL